MPRALVTVGTTKFDSLLRAADELAAARPSWEFVFQVGPGGYEPRSGRAFARTPAFRDEIEAADAVIAHGGAGTLFALAQMGKPTIAVPNLERKDPHQIDLTRYFADKGYCLAADAPSSLPEAFARLGDFEPAPFSEQPFDPAAFGEAVGLSASTRISILATEGGHVDQARLLARKLVECLPGIAPTIFTDAPAEDDAGDLAWETIPRFSGKESSVPRRAVEILRSAMSADAFRQFSRASGADCVVALGAGGTILPALVASLRRRTLVLLESRSRIRTTSSTYRALSPFTSHRIRQYARGEAACFGTLY